VVRPAPGNENQGGKADFHWQPDSLKIEAGLSATSMLVIKEPAAADLIIPLTVQQGVGALVTGPTQVTIPAGQRMVTVEFTAGATPGQLVLRATLPASAVAAVADLMIAVKPADD